MSEVKVLLRHKEEADELLGGAEIVFQGEYDELLDKVGEILAKAEHSARESAQGEGWKRAPGELPDSGLMVVVATEEHDDYEIATLEFTDDSEGHGEPYWSCDGGDLAICNYPNWMLLAPKAEGKP